MSSEKGINEVNPKTWYSIFRSKSGNAHWFTLRLNADRTEATLELKAKRNDALRVEPDNRVHIETSGPYISLLAKDLNAPNGIASMILHPDGEETLIGQVIWNSLTDGKNGIVRVKESREIVFTTTPSADHPAA